MSKKRLKTLCKKANGQWLMANSPKNISIIAVLCVKFFIFAE